MSPHRWTATRPWNGSTTLRVCKCRRCGVHRLVRWNKHTNAFGEFSGRGRPGWSKSYVPAGVDLAQVLTGAAARLGSAHEQLDRPPCIDQRRLELPLEDQAIEAGRRG